MKTSPASVASAAATATSDGLVSDSRTMVATPQRHWLNIAAHLDAAVVGIRGDVLGLGPDLRVGATGGDILVLSGPVRLQNGEQPVAAALGPRSGGCARRCTTADRP